MNNMIAMQMSHAASDVERPVQCSCTPYVLLFVVPKTVRDRTCVHKREDQGHNSAPVNSSPSLTPIAKEIVAAADDSQNVRMLVDCKSGLKLVQHVGGK